jgi:hypothetical protein
MDAHEQPVLSPSPSESSPSRKSSTEVGASTEQNASKSAAGGACANGRSPRL